MRLIQHEEKPASLSKWLSREVPQEREMLSETLDEMGWEKSLDALLHLHDKEETRRQKRLNKLLGYLMIPLLLTSVCACLGMLRGEILTPDGPHSGYFPLMIVASTLPIHLHNLWTRTGRRKKTPVFSTIVQQNVITELLEHPNNPLLADALARATQYYAGDKSKLYQKLAHILPLLPADKEALTKPARRALSFVAHTPAPYVRSETEKESIIVLQAAIHRYRARTEKPTPSSEVWPRSEAKARRLKRLEKSLLSFWKFVGNNRQG